MKNLAEAFVEFANNCMGQAQTIEDSARCIKVLSKKETHYKPLTPKEYGERLKKRT